MTTHFITAEIDLQEAPAQLHKTIEAELQQHGAALRWAITDVNIERQKATIEAVVTLESKTPANKL